MVDQNTDPRDSHGAALLMIADLNRSLADQSLELAALRLAVAGARKALRPFKVFADSFDAKPINGLHQSEIYGIHGGDSVSPHGASLRWEHIRRARAALALLPAPKNCSKRIKPDAD